MARTDSALEALERSLSCAGKGALVRQVRNERIVIAVLSGKIEKATLLAIELEASALNEHGTGLSAARIARDLLDAAEDGATRSAVEEFSRAAVREER